MTESWKNASGVMKSPGKVLEFLVTKRLGTLLTIEDQLVPDVNIHFYWPLFCH